MQKRGPWLAVAAMAVLVVILLVVLLLRGGGANVEDRLAAAPAAVDAEGSATLEMTVEVDSEGIQVQVRGTGGVDFASGNGWFDLELPGQRVEMRSTPDTLFARPAGGDQWVAVHADEAGDALDSLGTGPGEATAFVDLLRGEATEVEDLGEEEVDGVRTRHLRAVIDLERALAATDDAGRAPLEELGELAGDDGALPLEVWLDEQDRPVRQRLEGEVQGVALVVTLDLTAWGEPLGVAIPPEGEVRDVEPEELALLFGAPVP